MNKYWQNNNNRKSYFSQKRSRLYAAGSRKRIFGSSYQKKSGELIARFFSWIFNFLKNVFKTKSFWKIIGVATVFFLLFSLSVFAYYSKDLPDPNGINLRNVAESTKIFDRNGELLYDIFGEAKRTIIPFDEIPESIKNATIALEDKDFYSHGGVDFSRIVFSALMDVVTFSKSQGASTITQQFIKNALLTNEKSFGRKIKEIVLAIQIERKFTKDEILSFYLNEVPYGNNAYGVQAAAQTYFGKNASEITLAESAYLAALPQAPTALSPYGPNRERLDGRKNIALQVMVEQGYITKEEKEIAVAEVVKFSPVKNAIQAPHFALYIQDLLVQKYGEKTLQEGGLRVETTLDLSLQKIAEEEITKQAEINATNWRAENAALVAIDPKTGQVLAWVGSKDYFNDEIDGQVNIPLRERQPGSSFKPYVYATAFKEGYSPSTMIMDVVTNFGKFGGEEYTPLNYSLKVFGPVSMRKALAGSLNIPAVKTIILAGVSDSIKTARDMGITTLTDESRYGPALVLGGGEVKLLDHVSAYGVFATGGIRNEPVTILRVINAEGKILEEYKEKSGQRVLDEQVAFLMNSVLSDNSARAFVFGAANHLTIGGRVVAAKTGTTQEYKDAWTIGYSPQLVAGVWVGNNDNTPMKPGSDGGVIAAPIWNAFMRRALEGKESLPFQRPEKIRDIRVDSLTGKLPTQYSPDTKPEVFASFAEPKEFDDAHILFDLTTGKPAKNSAPASNTQVFTVLRSEKPNEENWENPVRAWSIQNGFTYPGIEDGYIPDPENEDFELEILEPQENTEINSLPFSIGTKASSPAGIKNLTIYFKDEQIFKAKSDNLTFFYSKSWPDGEYLLRIVAEDNNGNTQETSRTVKYNLGNNLVLTDPTDSTVIFFPYQLNAVGNNNTNGVEFFYQRSDETAVRIAGTTQATPQNSGSAIKFSLTWQGLEQPEAGIYEIFAQNNKAEQSNRVKIIIP